MIYKALASGLPRGGGGFASCSTRILIVRNPITVGHFRVLNTRKICLVPEHMLLASKHSRGNLLGLNFCLGLDVQLDYTFYNVIINKYKLI